MLRKARRSKVRWNNIWKQTNVNAKLDTQTPQKPSTSILPLSNEPEITDSVDQLLGPSEDEKPRVHRSSLKTITKVVQEEIPNLNGLTANNYDQILNRFKATFDEAVHTSEMCAKEYIDQAGAIEIALTALAEYNRTALEQLSKLTLNAIKKLDTPGSVPYEDKLKASEALVQQAKLLVETAEKQLEYSQKIGSVARPLTVWRLDASKAVWEANNALKSAESRFAEMKEKLPTPQRPQTPIASRITTEVPESDSEKLNPIKPKLTPILKLSSAGPSVLSTSRSAPTETESSSISDDGTAPVKEQTDVEEHKREPIKCWPKHTYTTASGELICYIRAPTDCLRRKEGIQCTFADSFAPWPPIPGHSEAIGRFVSIHPVKKEKNLMLPDEPWIIGIPHSYAKASSKEPTLYMIEAGSKGVSALEEETKKVKQTELVSWHDMYTTDVKSSDYHCLEARFNRLSDITFAPIARLRRDTVEIGRTGGRLMCLADPRIVINVWPEAIKVDLPFTIQVQQFDHQQLQAIKEQHQMLMNDFISCSPLVYLTCPRKVLFKPVQLTVPISDLPSAQLSGVNQTHVENTYHDKGITEASLASEEISGATLSKSAPRIQYDDFQKSLLLPHILAGSRAEVFEMVLMQKSEKSEDKWVVWNAVDKTEVNSNIAAFNLNRIESCRLMALKMHKVPDKDILSQCANLLEQSLTQHLVYFALRQHQKNPNQLCLLLALKDQLESSLQTLAEEGYREGNKPHGPVFLSDNQHLDVLFRSNIRPSPESGTGSHALKNGMKIKFTTTMANRHKLTVQAIDTSAQLGLENYRGFVDIYCMREILVPTGPESGKPPVNLHRIGGHRQVNPINTTRQKRARFKLSTERTHLARIVIKLPKQKTGSTKIPRPPSFDFIAKDIVTQKYLKELASKLTGDTWKRLGSALDLSRSRLQAISGKSAGQTEDSGFAMLLSWVKTLPVSASRFALLYRALQAIGRGDLAAEMYTANGEYYDEDEESRTKNSR